MSSGFAFETQVNSGGVQAVYGYSSEAKSTTVNAGGVEVISGAGALDVGAAISGVQIILAGGTTSGARINSGGYQIVEAGGHSLDTIVDGGMVEI